ncbi:hypothetical protein CUMW_160250, partial [Citrus unshiu]
KILPIKGSSHLRAWHPKSKRSNPIESIQLEHLAPQYGYYEFALLRGIYQDYVFGAWVRENYL